MYFAVNLESLKEAFLVPLLTVIANYAVHEVGFEGLSGYKACFCCCQTSKAPVSALNFCAKKVAGYNMHWVALTV